MIPSLSSGLSIVHWNARGLLSSQAEFLSFLRTSPDLVLISETRLAPSAPLHIPNFHILRSDPPSSRAGGLACVVSSPLASFLSPLPSSPPSPHFCFFRLLSSPFPLTLASVYLPPSSPLSLLDSFFSALRSLPPPWLVVGDFNAHHPLWGSPDSCPRGDLLETFLSDLDLFVLNSGQPTFLSSSHGTFSHIDLAFASHSVARISSWSVFPDSLGSDHFPCRIDLRLRPPAPSIAILPSWILHRADWSTFQHSLDAFLESHPLPPDSPLSTAYNTFVAALNHAGSSSMPSRRPGPSRRPLVPWWTDSCAAAVRAKRRAYQRLRHSATPDNLADYKRLCAVARRTVRTAQQTAWRQFCTSLSSSTPPSVIWRRLRSLDFNRPQNAAILPALDMDAKFAALHQVFISKIPQQVISTQRTEQVYRTNETLLIQPCSCTSPLCLPFSRSELTTAIRKLRSTAPGPDNLPPLFLSHLSDSAQTSLLALFNLSWSTSSVPTSWTHSLVIPVLKPLRSSSLPSSFRPISLTSSLCRLMEHMLLRRLNSHFAITGHLSPHQLGFIPGRSALHGHLLLEHDIRCSFHRRADTVACFLDLDRAFDTVWHPGLLLKCHTLGLPLCFIRWINSLLTNRTYQIKICNSLSQPFCTSNGTPQGSVLSPLLFNIMLHDLPSVLPPNVRVSIYADDICLWTSGKNVTSIMRTLQIALDRLETWAMTWGFQFSASKSSTLHFTRRPQPRRPPHLTLHSSPIPFTDTHHYLGFTFDRRLTWNPHIQHLRATCSKRLHLLRYISGQAWGSDRYTLLTLYCTLIRPILEYGAPVFLNAPHSFFSGLERIQAAGLRAATGLLRSTPQMALLVDTGIEPIRLRLHRLGLRLLLNTFTKSPDSPLARLFSVYLPSPSSWRFSEPALVSCASLLRPFLPSFPPLRSPLAHPSWLLSPLPVVLPPFPPRSLSDPSVLRTLFFEAISSTHGESLHIYTDGSFNPDTGASSSSFCIPHNNFDFACSLPLHTGIFFSELFAIFAALQHLSSFSPCSLYIFSDSQAALSALQSCSSSPTNTLLLDILELHHSLLCSGFNITLHWVPAHCGVPGNERADQLASSPDLLPSPSYSFPINILYLTNNAISPLIRQWQASWDNLHTARHFHTIKPTVERWSHLNFGPRFVTTPLGRLRTGHCLLRQPLLRHGAEVAPTCRFCGNMETIEHILLDCPHLNRPRLLHLEPILRSCPRGTSPLSYLLAGGIPPFDSYRTIFLAIHSFLDAANIQV